MILSEPAIPAIEPPPEADLVIRAQGGDRLAMAELTERHRHAAYCFALQLLGNPDDALDVAQDAMLRFLTHLDRFDVGRPVKPWLLRIVRNRVHDLRRRRRVRRHQSLDEVRDDAPPLEVIDTAMDPEDDARRAQLKARIWQALGQLTETQREILVLRDYQDLSYAEIAATLGIPLGTVMSRLHGARRRLRQVIVDELPSYARRASSEEPH